MDVREEAVDVPPEVLGDARAALVVRPGDTLIVALDSDTQTQAHLEEVAERFRAQFPDLAERVLFVAGVEALAVLRGDVP